MLDDQNPTNEEYYRRYWRLSNTLSDTIVLIVFLEKIEEYQADITTHNGNEYYAIKRALLVLCQVIKERIILNICKMCSDEGEDVNSLPKLGSYLRGLDQPIEARAGFSALLNHRLQELTDARNGFIAHDLLSHQEPTLRNFIQKVKEIVDEITRIFNGLCYKELDYRVSEFDDKTEDLFENTFGLGFETIIQKSFDIEQSND